MLKTVRQLASKAFSVWHEALDEAQDVVVSPSAPILYFGDLDAYLVSPQRILTVGLNPSYNEFPAREPFRRFPLIAQIDLKGDGRTDIDGYISSLNRYFRIDPYRRWFDNGFEPVLRGMSASYYRGSENSVFHTDLCSPVATARIWTDLTKDQKKELLARGRPLWHALVRVLRPDVLLVSIRQEYLSNVEFERTGVAREIVRIERSNPYSVIAQWLRVGPEKKALLAFGRAAQLPFGTVKFVDRRRIGAQILDFFRVG